MDDQADFGGERLELWLDEDSDWLAVLSRFPHVSAFGDTPEAAIQALREVYVDVAEYLPK